MSLHSEKAVATFNASLTAALDTTEAYQFLPDGTWMEGGCALLGEALRACLGGKLVTVGRVTRLGVVDHVVLEISTGSQICFIDYDGLQSKAVIERKVRTEWGFSSVAWDEFNEDALRHCGVPVDTVKSKSLALLLMRQGVFNHFPKECPRAV